MSAPDRLPELLRQRELIKEHLAWIEQEIAAASDKSWPPSVEPKGTIGAKVALDPGAKPKPASPPPVVKAVAEFSPSMGDEIIEQYRVAPNTLQTDLRKGCLLYFLGALGLLAAGVATLFFFFQRGR